MRNQLSFFIRPARPLILLVLCALLGAWVPAAAPALNIPNPASIASSLNPSNFGQCVTFTYRVIESGAPNVRVPGGTTGFAQVNFYDGTTLIGQGNTTSILGVLTSTITICTLSIGHHTIKGQLGIDGGVDPATLDQLVLGPSEVPEADTLILMGSGLSGLATWVGVAVSQAARQEMNLPVAQQPQEQIACSWGCCLAASVFGFSMRNV